MEETLEVLSQIIPTPSKDQNVDENVPLNEVQLPSINNIQNGSNIPNTQDQTGNKNDDTSNVVVGQNIQGGDKIQNGVDIENIQDGDQYGGFVPIATDDTKDVIDEPTGDVIDNSRPIDSSNANLDSAEGKIIFIKINYCKLSTFSPE